MSDYTSNQYLRDYSKRDKIWDSQKNTSLQVTNTFFSFQRAVYGFRKADEASISVINSIFDEIPDHNTLIDLGRLAVQKAFVMSECGQNLVFALNANSDGELVHRLFRAEFCKFRFCPICTWRKSLKLKALFLSRADRIIQENEGLTYLFLTLTMKNDSVEIIDQMLDKLNSSFRKVTQQKFFKSVVKGSIKVIEITRSKDGEAHPHLHVILAVSSGYFKSKTYKKTEGWVKTWRKALKVDYDPIVDIRRIYSKKSGSNSLKGIVAEGLKYAVKGSDLRDMKFLIHLTDKTKGKRFISATGVFQGIFKDEFSDNELIKIDVEDEDKTQKPDDIRVYCFKSKFRKYVRDLILEEKEILRLEQEALLAQNNTP